MNWKLFDAITPILVQGIMGKEGSRMTRWLIASGINVACGVEPGQAGQEIEGRPVYPTVAVAKSYHPNLEVTSIVVPPRFAIDAVREAVLAGIKYVHLLTERVPTHDVLAMRDVAASHGAVILGPSSVGYLQFPAFRLGYLGGELPFTVLQEGSVGIVSTSGGMTNELMMSLSRNGIGVKTAMALGGDRVVGLTLEQAIRWNESLDRVKSLALFVEPGRPLLRSLADGSFTFTKPTVVFLAGEALDGLPRGLPYGHTGTVLGEDDRSVRETRKLLHTRGITCVGTMSDFLEACKWHA